MKDSRAFPHQDKSSECRHVDYVGQQGIVKSAIVNSDIVARREKC